METLRMKFINKEIKLIYSLLQGLINLKMILPNADKVIINPAKITDYVLNYEHFEGKHKAKVFESALGLNKGNASFLITEIKKAVLGEDAIKQSESVFGERWIVDFSLKFNDSEVLIRTAWIIDYKDNIPRFVTCYVK